VSDPRATCRPVAAANPTHERTVRILKHAADGTQKEIVMADSMQDSVVQLRAKVRAAETAQGRAAARASDSEKALKWNATPAAREANELAAAELAATQAALAEATGELENLLEDRREANADDPLPPQTDYKLREIVEKLSYFQQRATYGAVGDFLNARAWMVRGWFRGSEAFDNSFVVAADTGEPTDYSASKVHPSLKRHPAILRNSDELLTWLQGNPLPVQRGR
jgi:hypothetical protein